MPVTVAVTAVLALAKYTRVATAVSVAVMASEAAALTFLTTSAVRLAFIDVVS
jgi:hypothetical protein